MRVMDQLSYGVALSMNYEYIVLYAYNNYSHYCLYIFPLV